MSRKVKALLVEKGIKQKDIAAALGVTAGCVSGTISGRFQSLRIRKAVAKVLKMPYAKVWGRAA